MDVVPALRKCLAASQLANHHLRQRDQQMRLALDSLGGGRWEWDIAHQKLSCYGRFYAAFGMEAADSDDAWERWHARRHPADAARLADKMERAKRGQLATYEAEFRILDTAGRWRWVISRGLVGERDAAGAQIPRIQAAISEAQRKIEEVELTLRNQARAELSETNAKLAALSAGSEGLADRVKQAEIRAPMNGTVKQLFANTVGGVVQPGKEIIEIVPSDDALLLEARVQPKDIAFLRPGQPAHVKFTAYDFSIYGGLDATLEHIGADSIVDEKGNAFYIVKVRTDRPTLGNNLPVIPGMVAEVDIITGEKSVLSYLLKPVLRAKARAFSER